MYRTIIMAVALSVVILPETQGQTESATGANNKAGAPTITITKLDINDEALHLVYEIKNDSEDDAWILVGWYEFSDTTFGMGAGVRMAEDGHTLMISARFNEPSSGGGVAPLYGRFVRLRPGDSQIESIFMTIPAYPVMPQLGHFERREQDVKHATRLAIELGYYQDSLSEKLLKTPKPHENVLPEEPNDTLVSRNIFSRLNERLNSRDDELLILDDRLEVKREEEQVTITVIENLNIPYEQKRDYTRKIKSPGLHSYEKIEIRYKPSILEFFFPYKSQQGLLSPDEMEYLQSDKTIVLNNAQDIYTVAHFIPHTRADTTVFVGFPVRYRSHAEVVCYSGGKPFLPFTICNDNAIVIEGKYLIIFEGLSSLKKLTPHIQAIDLRTRCANNLKNQWYRLRFYNLREAIRQNDPSVRNQTMYPDITEWCDAMLRHYPILGGFAGGKWHKQWHVCPSAGKGKNHHAMNPNCKPDSPSDMVLLFETKAGWNQHGGPELFTFDNHEPKGGCVLLNDGTVKFIRTKEELQQLRWK